MMMVARKVVRLPAAMEGTLSKKDEFYNHVCVCGCIEKRELGWSCDIVDSSGKAFINMLAEMFWCIGPHHGSLDGSTSKRTKGCEMSLSLSACLCTAGNTIIMLAATCPHAFINSLGVRNHKITFMALLHEISPKQPLKCQNQCVGHMNKSHTILMFITELIKLQGSAK